MSQFHSLKILDKKQETPNAVSLAFDVPASLRDAFKFKAGQYLTLRYFKDGKEIRRSYSLCSSELSGEWRIGIKRIEAGYFSKIVNDTIETGDILDVMIPQGLFVFNADNKHSKNYLAVVAGSGITPVLSMIKTMLEKEPNSTFTLAYGNQTRNETMFYEELESLRQRYPERLHISYFFSRENVQGCRFGRIDRSMVNFMLKNEYKDTVFHSCFLCGPEAMITEVTNTLLDFGIRKENIHFELFTSSEKAPEGEVPSGQTKATITLDEETVHFSMPREKSLLDAALDHGLDAPYSCKGGICSTCIARLKEGQVEMKKNMVLTDGELEDNLILTCQSHPLTESVVVDYDDV